MGRSFSTAAGAVLTRELFLTPSLVIGKGQVGARRQEILSVTLAVIRLEM